jgi:hypothetical protein
VTRFTAQRVQVATGCKDQVGLLVFVDGALVALFVRLAEVSHGPDCGRWYLEVGFGCHETKHEPFETLRDAFAWVAGHVPNGKNWDEAELDNLATTAEVGLVDQ